MEPNQQNQSLPSKIFPEWLTTVTPLSKVFAMILFITLPFLGFYLGTQYQQKSIVATPVVSEVQKTAAPQPTTSTQNNIYAEEWVPFDLSNNESNDVFDLSKWNNFVSSDVSYSLYYPLDWETKYVTTKKDQLYTGICPVLNKDCTELVISKQPQADYNPDFQGILSLRLYQEVNVDHITDLDKLLQLSIKQITPIWHTVVEVKGVKMIKVVAPGMVPSYWIIFANNNYIYTMSFDGGYTNISQELPFEVENQILKTFKFLK